MQDYKNPEPMSTVPNSSPLRQPNHQMSMNPISPNHKKSFKYSIASILFSLVLMAFLIMLFERLTYDLNRFFNPAINEEYTEKMNGMDDASDMEYFNDLKKNKIEVDSSLLSNKKTYYEGSNGRYIMYKTLIYAIIIIPFFIISFILYYIKKDPKIRPLLGSFIGTSIFLMFHLFGMVMDLVTESYKNLVVYLIIGALIIAFGYLTYYIQAKYQEKKEKIS